MDNYWGAAPEAGCGSRVLGRGAATETSRALPRGHPCEESRQPPPPSCFGRCRALTGPGCALGKTLRAP